MTESDIAEIKDRLAATSEGEWELHSTSTLYMDGKAEYTIKHKGQPGFKIVLTAYEEDAEFIAHSKEDIRKLLRKIDELELEVEALKEDLNDSFLEMEIARESYPEID